MLTDTNLAQAEATLQQGLASDRSFPPQTVYLEKTSDTARNVRFLSFDNAIQECRARDDNAVTRTNSDSTALTDALGLDTGLTDLLAAGQRLRPRRGRGQLDVLWRVYS